MSGTGAYGDLTGDLESVRKLLDRFGQAHLLDFYDELDESERRSLLDQVRRADFGVVQRARTAPPANAGTISPIDALQLGNIASKRGEYAEAGINALRTGRVAAVMLAGGMGTRLGTDGPKGVYDIGITHPLYIFECLFNNLMSVVDECGAFIHLFIMTSALNHEATVRFLTEHCFFGYDPGYVHIYEQGMVVSTDFEGRCYMESKSKLAISPDGNGGFYAALKAAGLYDIIQSSGIEWLNVFAVDNVLQRIADPVFVGAALQHGTPCAAKVVRKNSPSENVGVMCLEDGHPSIIEYYELTDEMRQAVDAAGRRVYDFGVILNYLFSIEALEETLAKRLPLHTVRKKIEHIDSDGNRVIPTEPNGYKYEALVLDMIREMSGCLPFEVERDREFAPIKNKTGVDSVDSARALLMKNGVML